MKRVLVTGGAGFIGSHLCERLLARGDEVLCVDNFFTSKRQNIMHLLGNRMFELMRHDITWPPYVGGPDLQPRVPRLAGPLPVRPGADDQDQRARRHQHAGPGQAPEGAHPSGLHLRGVRRPVGASAEGNVLGLVLNRDPRTGVTNRKH